MPGVYCSESIEYAGQYATSTQLFGDGLFYKCIFVLQTNSHNPRKEKKANTRKHEIVFAGHELYITGLIVFADVALSEGDRRFYSFDSHDEMIPIGCAVPPRIDAVQNVCRHVTEWHGP